jgi:DNA-binding NarL/FixJ family response regulator
MSEIKLLIVEDEAIIAEDIAELCGTLGYEVIETAHTAGQALNILKAQIPDLILLDINLEDDIDGIEIADYINEKYNIPFIYLTSYADIDTLMRAKKTKPMGYIVKPFNKEQLLSTIEIALYNASQNSIPGGLDIDFINKKLSFNITGREAAILGHIFNGKTNKQMGELENISVNTVKYYIKQLYSKFDANSRSSLIARIRDTMQ